jgi:hypothetical protein
MPSSLGLPEGFIALTRNDFWIEADVAQLWGSERGQLVPVAKTPAPDAEEGSESGYCAPKRRALVSCGTAARENLSHGASHLLGILVAE